MSSTKRFNCSKIHRETGLSISYLSRIWRGERNPRMDTLRKIAGSMKITVDQLDRMLMRKREEWARRVCGNE